MNRTALLLGTDIRGIRNYFRKGDRTSKTWRLASALVIACLFWMGAYAFFRVIFAYLYSMPLFGPILATRLLATVFLIFLFMILFSDIVTALSSLYLGKDLSFLISKPLEMGHIVAQKLVRVFVFGAWVVLCFGLPMFMAYGRANDAHWVFSPLSLPLVLPFLMIPAGLAVVLTMIVARFLPVRHMRLLLVSFVMFFGGATFGLFRIIRPEILTSPERISQLDQYLYQLRSTDSLYLPSAWLMQSFKAIMDGRGWDGAFYWLLMVLTAGVGVILSLWLAPLIYHRGWDRAQSGATSTRTRRGPRRSRAFVPGARSLIMKDMKLFVRDPSQWAQLVFLVSLVVVYLLNSRRLPVDVEELFWMNLLSFVNLGLTAYIMATIALKFVFPGVSMEGRSFWVVGASPLGMRRFLAAKFWSSLLLLLLPAELLMILSGVILKIGFTMQMISAVTMLALTFGITAMAVGMGAMMPRFDLEDSAEISSGLGGLINIIFALIYVVSVIALIAWPVHLSIGRGIPLAWTMPRVQVAVLGFVIINAAAIWLPMRLGLRALLSRDMLP